MRVSTFAFGVALAAVLLWIGCGGRGEAVDSADRTSSRSIEQVLDAHRDSLMALPGVLGVAQGLCDGRPCIRVFAVDSAAAARAPIPAQLEGHPVRVEVSGPFRPR